MLQAKDHTVWVRFNAVGAEETPITQLSSVIGS